jgi:hypothetical protein
MDGDLTVKDLVDMFAQMNRPVDRGRVEIFCVASEEEAMREFIHKHLGIDDDKGEAK